MKKASIRESNPKELNNKCLTKRTISLFEELSDQRHHIKGVFDLFKGHQDISDLNRESIESAAKESQLRFSALETRLETVASRCDELVSENNSLKARVSFLELNYHLEKDAVASVSHGRNEKARENGRALARDGRMDLF